MMNNTKTALDIYQGGYVDNNIDFYNHLKDAVIREYKYFGFCELVDCLLLTDKITDIIVIASIINSANEFECKSDHLPKEKNMFHVPHIMANVLNGQIVMHLGQWKYLLLTTDSTS